MMFQQGDRVRMLLSKGVISPELYLVEEDRNSGNIKLIRESTIQRDEIHNIIRGARVYVNSARVFSEDIINKAPVIHTSPEEAVAHCPTCGEQHSVTMADLVITCTKHGVFELFRTKEHVAKKRSPVPIQAKDTKVETVTLQEPATEPAVTTFNIADMKAMGELWGKRLEFDYPTVDARGYILFIVVEDITYKHCFNTYNGSLGKKNITNDITKFSSTKGAYVVKDIQKAREQIVAKGYTLVS